MHTLVRVKNAYTVMTICLIALGAALLFAPQLGLRTLCVVYGVFLIVYGVTKLSGYFAKAVSYTHLTLPTNSLV